MIFVVDSSAILAIVFEEPGADYVSALLPTSSIGTVNLSEVAAKLLDKGFTKDEVVARLDAFPIGVVPFDESQAVASGMLRESTRHKGLSLGDRACLALAIREQATVITADRNWSGLDLGIEIKVIR